MPDPLLTKHGESQCATLAASFPHTARITHLVASPLRRTILTALLSFPSLVEPPKSLKILALPELQETSDAPCDTGSAPEVLEHDFGLGQYAGKVDLSRVEEGWNRKSPLSPWSPAPEKVEARAAVSRRFLRELGQEYEERTGEEAHIAVVTHGGFLHFATEDWTGFKKVKGTGWENTEWRSYVFGEGEKKESLVETGESCKRRAGSEIPLTADEEREFNASIGGLKE
ncbi:hypothetical protein V500_04467 [Pseudogymnoascus sp. VKM F-4518 (FW-2643)]|nr:hypothetical protein V500_04467 [Pseudogymnoascus sp. VKM F-4518 (FW-2643)]